MALQLRPNCEYCDKDLPPHSLEARICSYECTFCADCVENKLHNVCPNCGGGFVARPIRPQRNGVLDWRLRSVPPRTSACICPTAWTISPRIRRSFAIFRRSSGESSARPCEPTGRANARPMAGSAKQSTHKVSVDCFVASLLAMTERIIPPPLSSPQPRQI